MDNLEIRRARKVFLDDTVSFYSVDPVARRAAIVVRHPDGKRQYNLCAFRMSDGRTCAIGRYIPKDKYERTMESAGGLMTENNPVMLALPEEVAVLGADFLHTIQGLHDGNDHWDATGLTPAGHRFVKYVVDTFIGVITEVTPKYPVYIEDVIDGFDLVKK